MSLMTAVADSAADPAKAADPAADPAKSAESAKAADPAKPAFSFIYDEASANDLFGAAESDGRPKNVQPKYWDADKKAIKGDVVLNQLKWAEGKLGNIPKVLGAPAEYTLPTVEGKDPIFTADDPMVKGFFEFAKTKDYSQETVNDVLGWYEASVGGIAEANVKAEMAKLGTGATQRVKDMADYLTANLEPTQAQTVMNLLTTADAFIAFEAMVKKGQPPKFTQNADTQPNTPQVSVDKWNEMYFAVDKNGHRLMSVDPVYAAKVNGMRDAVFGVDRKDENGRPR